MAAEESRTPRHGRHSAAGRHAAPRAAQPEPEVSLEETGALSAQAQDATAQPARAKRMAAPAAQEAPAAQAPATVAPESIPQLVTISDGDQETHMGDAPRPIDVDPQETGSFRKIEASEGARLTTRANASDTSSFVAQNARPVEAVRMSTAGRPKVEHHDVEMESNKRVFVVLAVAALLVVAVVGSLLTKAFSSVEEVAEDPITEQTQVAVEESIDYRGATYTVTDRGDGKYALVSQSEGSSEQSVIYELSGTPVALILYNTVFIIPENLPDGTFDLIAHPLGEGSVTQQITDADGNPVVGTGEISEVTLSGDTIKVVCSSGEAYEVSLT